MTDLIILNNISFNILHNKKIAIVGSSGGGKSTIFNLLLRLYQPTAGNIYIDDIDINDIDESSLVKNISVVRQEPFIFSTSLKENLLLANPEATDEEMIVACKEAYIHDFITNLPDGYNTLLKENGLNLSGGQKQRLSIARALLKKSQIILFDEATSSLDNESQFNIKKAINKLSLNHTVVIIAHRLLTVIDADNILVIENGKVVGEGRHRELMETCQEYIKLFKSEVDILSEKREISLIYE